MIHFRCICVCVTLSQNVSYKLSMFFYMKRNICVERERERERWIDLTLSPPLPLSKIVGFTWLWGESWKDWHKGFYKMNFTCIATRLRMTFKFHLPPPPPHTQTHNAHFSRISRKTVKLGNNSIFNIFVNIF